MIKRLLFIALLLSPSLLFAQDIDHWAGAELGVDIDHWAGGEIGVDIDHWTGGELPTSSGTTLSDDFSSDTSTNYTMVDGAWELSSETFIGGYDYGPNIAINTTSLASNCTVAADIYIPDSSHDGGVCFASDGSTDGYCVQIRYDGRVYLRDIADWDTELDIDTSNTFSGAGTYALEVVRSGSAITVYVDGSEEASFTASAYSGTHVGFVANSGNGGGEHIDNFSAE